MMGRRGERSSEHRCRIRDDDEGFTNRSKLHNVKRAIDMDEEDKNCVLPPIHFKNHSIGNANSFLHKEGQHKLDEARTPVGKPRSRLISLLQSQNRDAINSDLRDSRDNKFCNPTSNNEEVDDTTYEEELDDQSDPGSENGFKLQIENLSKYPSKF